MKVAEIKVYFKNGTVIEKEVTCGETEPEQIECALKLKQIFETIENAYRDNVEAHIEILGLHFRLSETIAFDFVPQEGDE